MTTGESSTSNSGSTTCSSSSSATSEADITPRHLQRLAQVEAVLLLERREIDMPKLREACIYGIPDGLRPLAWRLLLDVLPKERHLWAEEMGKQRAQYHQLVDQLVVQPHFHNDNEGRSRPSTSGEAVVEEGGGDHPLSGSSDSPWAGWWADNVVLAQIDKDCRRLCPSINFFQTRTRYPHAKAAAVQLSRRISQQHSTLKCESRDARGQRIVRHVDQEDDEEADGADGGEATEKHWQVVERLLFVFAKLNPGLKYVQGMNEVLGPLYYVFSADADAEWAAHAEADAYACFQRLMCRIQDNFVARLDDSQAGIEARMAEFHRMLQHFDPTLYTHLVQELAIRPQFYAFRWLSLMLSQEFPLPDVIQLWDSLLADWSESGAAATSELLPFVCLAMVERQRAVLMESDFSQAIRLLQNYPVVDVYQLVCLALDIRAGRVQSPDDLTAAGSSSGGNPQSSILPPSAKALADEARSAARQLVSNLGTRFAMLRK